MQLEFNLKNAYGTFRYYPINARAKLVADLLNKKTLSEDELNKLKAIGFELILTQHGIPGKNPE